MSLESNPSTLYTYIHQYIHKDRCTHYDLKTQRSQYQNERRYKFTGMLHAPQLCCRETFVLKISSDPFPGAFMGRGKSLYRLIKKNNVQVLLTKLYSSPQQCCGYSGL